MDNINILPTTPAPMPPRKKSVHSPLSILFMIILTAVLIILAEKVMSDVNKSFNPYSTSSISKQTISSNYRVYSQDKYEAGRLLIHAGITLPILLGALLFYLLHERKTGSGAHIVSWSFFALAFWLCIRLIGEIFYFLIRKYESLGVYVVLIVLGVVLTWLVVALQRRYTHQKSLHLQ